MTSITSTEARKYFYRLLNHVHESHEPIQITSRRGNVILVGDEDWQSIQGTLSLLSIPNMRKSIVKGLKTPVTKCSDNLRW